MFYLTLAVPNPNFKLFGISKQKEKQKKTYNYIMHRSRNAKQHEQRIETKFENDLKEHIELESLSKEQLIKSLDERSNSILRYNETMVSQEYRVSFNILYLSLSPFINIIQILFNMT